MSPFHLHSAVVTQTMKDSLTTPVFAALAATFLLAGCATLFSSTSDDIQFESEPSEATVIIDGVERGETPTTVTVGRDAFNDKRVTLQKEGYEDEVFRLRKEFTTVAILNLGNFLFWGIDALTGAMFKYRPTQYDQELESESMGSLRLDLEESTADAQDVSAYGVNELRDESTGEVVLPEQNDNVIVHDEEKGVAYVFE